MTWLTVKPNLMNRRNLNFDVDSMFDNFFSNQSACSPEHHSACHQEQNTFWPAVDIHEKDDEITLTLEAPGASKEDIKVTVKDRVLTIEGERKTDSETEASKLLVNEIRSGSFSRKFTLPKTIDSSKIKADFANGLLKVTLAKLEEVKPKEIEVSVK